MTCSACAAACSEEVQEKAKACLAEAEAELAAARNDRR